MRKTLLLIFALCVSIGMYGQQFGVVGGLTTSNVSLKNIDVKSMSQYHLGLAYNQPLVLGFALEPELLYNVKGMAVKDYSGTSFSQVLDSFSMGYLELGLQVQWGLDLGVVGAHVFLEPYAGYALNNKSEFSGDASLSNQWDGLNRFECGLGIGLGADIIKHIRVSLKYYRNLGSIGSDSWNDIVDAVSEIVPDLLKGGDNFSGLVLSAGIFF